jgi:prevent-host-death family protein
MVKRIPLSEVKSKLSEMVDDVLHHGEHIVIERRGKPVAGLVSMNDLVNLGVVPANPDSRGLLALAGAWSGLITDEEVDEMVAHIYATREADTGREVNLEA